MPRLVIGEENLPLGLAYALAEAVNLVARADGADKSFSETTPRVIVEAVIARKQSMYASSKSN